jgi:hypothetical protein
MLPDKYRATVRVEHDMTWPHWLLGNALQLDDGTLVMAQGGNLVHVAPGLLVGLHQDGRIDVVTPEELAA